MWLESSLNESVNSHWNSSTSHFTGLWRPACEAPGPGPSLHPQFVHSNSTPNLVQESWRLSLLWWAFLCCDSLENRCSAEALHSLSSCSNQRLNRFQKHKLLLHFPQPSQSKCIEVRHYSFCNTESCTSQCHCLCQMTEGFSVCLPGVEILR